MPFSWRVCIYMGVRMCLAYMNVTWCGGVRVYEAGRAVRCCAVTAALFP